MAQGLEGAEELLKHAPFCKPNCPYIHHPLLMTIFNFKIADVKESISVIEAEIHKLEKAFMPNSVRWLKHMDIPDPSVNFQYSALHWACAFGYTELVQWLISQGIPSRVQHKNSGQTPLHRAVVCLQKTCGKSAVAKLESMLPCLYQALQVGDGEGNTPLHLASSMLHLERPTPAFYADCITLFLTYAKGRGEAFLIEVVNKKNRDGDTCCHILAMQDRNLNSLKTLVEHKADLGMQNVEGVTALNVAQKLGQMKNSCFLQSVTETVPDPPMEKNPTNSKQKNAKGTLVVKVVDAAKSIQNGSPEKATAGVKRGAPAAATSPTRSAKVARTTSPLAASSTSAVLNPAATTPSSAPASKRTSTATKTATTKAVTPAPNRVTASVTQLRGQASTSTAGSAATTSSQAFTKPAQVSTVVMKTRNAVAQQTLQSLPVVVVSSGPLLQTPEKGASAGQMVVNPQLQMIPAMSSSRGEASASTKMKKLLLMFSGSGSETAEENANAKEDGRAAEVEVLETVPAPSTSTPRSSRVSNGAAQESESADQDAEEAAKTPSPALSQANSKSALSSMSSGTPNNTALASYLKLCSPDVRKILLENIQKDENTSKERMEHLRKDVEACRQQKEEIKAQLQQKQSRMQQLLDEVLEIESSMHKLEEEHSKLEEELSQGSSRLQQEEQWVGTITLASQDLSHIFES